MDEQAPVNNLKIKTIMKNLLRAALVSTIIMSLTGCGLALTKADFAPRYAAMTTAELMDEHNAMSAGSYTIFGGQEGFLLKQEMGLSLVDEIESRGYACNPTGCFNIEEMKDLLQ